jgi:hypothetical protein
VFVIPYCDHITHRTLLITRLHCQVSMSKTRRSTCNYWQRTSRNLWRVRYGIVWATWGANSYAAAPEYCPVMCFGVSGVRRFGQSDLWVAKDWVTTITPLAAPQWHPHSMQQRLKGQRYIPVGKSIQSVNLAHILRPAGRPTATGVSCKERHFHSDYLAQPISCSVVTREVSGSRVVVTWIWPFKFK